LVSLGLGMPPENISCRRSDILEVSKFCIII
jgi:hypothetical protein